MLPPRGENLRAGSKFRASLKVGLVGCVSQESEGDRLKKKGYVFFLTLH